MPTFTAQQLIDRAQAAADMHDDFVTTAQWLAWLSVEVQNLDRHIAQSGYVLRESSWTVTANGAVSYPFEVEPFAVLAVYAVDGGRYRRLRATDMFDGRPGRDTADTGQSHTYRITLANDAITLHLHPTPTSGTYEVVYIPVSPVAATVAQTYLYPLGWEERVVLGMARRALAKEETTNPALETEVRRIEEHIEQTAWSRMYANSASRVRNVDDVERGWFDAPGIPPRDQWMFV